MSDLVEASVTELRKALQAVREAHSPFIKAMTEAMEGYAQMRADGLLSQAECIKGLEVCLREAWQVRNPRVWRAECRDCDDTGWQPWHCPDRLCQRREDHAPHDYVTVCPCRAMNHTYQRKHGKSEDEMDSKLAAAASTKARR